MSRLITKPYYEERTSTTTLMIAHIQCDTAADLPAPTDFNGVTLLLSSVADVIDTGERYKMRSDGTWILQPVAQADAYTRQQTDTLLQQRIPYMLTDQIGQGADLDTYTTPGSWRCTSTNVSHYPQTTAQGRLDVIEIDSINGYMQQQLHCVGALGRVFIRTMSAASPPAWNAWIEIEMIGRLGTSIPAGADLNTYRTPGKFYSPSVAASQQTINRPDYTPTTNIRFYMDVSIGCTTSTFVQDFCAVDVSSANYGVLTMYRRIGNASSWGSWYQINTATIAPYNPT